MAKNIIRGSTMTQATWVLGRRLGFSPGSEGQERIFVRHEENTAATAVCSGLRSRVRI